MRFSALIPVVFGLVALVLSFLCVFAGSSKGFMDDYAIVTLNTSRIGENLLNASTTSSSSSDPLVNFLQNVTSSIQSDINNDVNNDLNSFARSLGVHDFYSAHILDYCEGFFTPGPVPNASLPADDIHMNITRCSNSSGSFQFDPQTILQRELNASGHGNINLTELHWPSAITDGLDALHVAQKAAFVLYCIGIALIGVATSFAFLSIFFEGRLSAFVNILLSSLAFTSIAIASIITTVIGVKAADLINKYGSHVGISATKGGKFLALTWVATALMFVSIFVWLVECCIGRRGHRSSRRGGYAEK